MADTLNEKMIWTCKVTFKFITVISVSSVATAPNHNILYCKPPYNISHGEQALGDKSVEKLLHTYLNL